MIQMLLNRAQKEYRELGTVLYLSGPMTGLPDYNRPEFNRIAAVLRNKGYQVINPVETCAHMHPEATTWQEYMRQDIKAMMDADMVIMLPGWQRSKGARAEMVLADMIDIPIRFYEEGVDPCSL